MDRTIEKQFINNDAMDLFKAINKLDDELETALFLRDILTYEELEEAIKRYKVAKLLAQGVTFREIAKQTNVSSATIARVNDWLKHGCGGYRFALKDILQK